MILAYLQRCVKTRQPSPLANEVDAFFPSLMKIKYLSLSVYSRVIRTGLFTAIILTSGDNDMIRIKI
ncbi:hypothetical protein EPIR_0494 [Erwinia piriflorinigrans CFBP 5888]|uniref:Uncharacterized protein n=1 Tax=Erwinia piriflorinigrans CFBP 5888 TaxID=1161919 RepID=V5Z4D0_9GAMM|nr:hypothetical protein EPIR_0494 [Erwinia piriflorinigrans CFBP 5888]